MREVPSIGLKIEEVEIELVREDEQLTRGEERVIFQASHRELQAALRVGQFELQFFRINATEIERRE